MPLKSGSSPSTISENIRELHHGPKHAQTARKFGEDRAHEQSIAIAMETARKTKRATGGKVHLGPVIGDTGGRADKVDTNVPNQSYVIPADIISGLGQGNTLHGLKVIERIFPHPRGSGGRSKGEPVPVSIADGEAVLSPEQLMAKFGGDIDHAHLAMDHWVEIERKNLIDTLQKLPGPATD